MKINFTKMKVNKIILRICHFFGFRRNEAHFDDVTIHIPTEYGNMSYGFVFTEELMILKNKHTEN